MTITIASPPLVQGRFKRLVTLWKITRLDGAVFRFTNHSNPINFAENADGQEFKYTPTGGVDASARRRETALKEANTGTVGVISSPAVRSEDLARGLFDEASFIEFTVDWRFPYLALQTVSYTAKSFSFDGEIWRGELVGITHLLHQDVGEFFARTCGRDLGDAKCMVNLPGISFVGVAVASLPNLASDNRLITSPITASLGVDHFMDGEILWTGGANLNTVSEIQSNTSNLAGKYELELYLPPAFPIQIGDLFTLAPGCDKSADTCRNKFSNLINFRGFNFMPGSDRYMGASPNT